MVSYHCKTHVVVTVLKYSFAGAITSASVAFDAHTGCLILVTAGDALIVFGSSRLRCILCSGFDSLCIMNDNYLLV